MDAAATQCTEYSLETRFVVSLFLVLAWYGEYSFSSGSGTSNYAAIAVNMRSPAANAAEASFRQAYGMALAQLPVPMWVYGPVWFVLYALNGLAGYVYWQCGHVDDTRFLATLIVWAVNLAVNKAWPVLFFDRMAPWYAMIDILLLDVLTVAALVLFAFDNVWTAFGLFIPYMLWLLVATYLNWRFIQTLRKLRAPPSGNAGAADERGSSASSIMNMSNIGRSAPSARSFVMAPDQARRRSRF